MGCLVMLIVCTSALNATEGKNPTRAALYSAFVPGGGQIYNEAYIKAGIVIGVQGYLIGSVLYHDRKADDYSQLAAEAETPALAEIYRTRRNEYQEMRTSDFWWVGITMGLSILDAWVDAHLYDYEADKEKIHLLFEADKLKLEYHF